MPNSQPDQKASGLRIFIVAARRKTMIRRVLSLILLLILLTRNLNPLSLRLRLRTLQKLCVGNSTSAGIIALKSGYGRSETPG